MMGTTDDGCREKDVPMICAGCRRELEVGDQYIEDSASGYIGAEADPMIDGLIADIMGGAGGKVIFCEDCTIPDPSSKYRFSTYYGDEEDNDA
jgi:hypothetical protein